MRHYDKAEIKKLSCRYILQSITIALVLTVLSVIYMYLAGMTEILLVPVVVSILFTVLIDTADAMLWRIVASRHTDILPTFFTAVSGFRMLFALLVMLIYYLVAGKDVMMPFFIVFMIYYVTMMIHHSRYFIKLMNGFELNKEK
ncbi:MAG: hypothetical protein ACI4V5_04070 [Prevotella sp.]